MALISRPHHLAAGVAIAILGSAHVHARQGGVDPSPVPQFSDVCIRDDGTASPMLRRRLCPVGRTAFPRVCGSGL